MALGTSVGVQPSGMGLLVAQKTFDAGALRKLYVRDDQNGHFLRSREALLLENEKRSRWRQELLAWLRDNVHHGIPRWYYNLVLGHDLHVSAYGTLHVKHFHAHQIDPFTGKMGWLENIGLVSAGKVTVAFRDFEIDQLISESAAYGDFKFHRVGTSAQAESNADTALITDAGLEATGTQVEAAADQYRSVAAITADSTETWQEHSIRNATGPTGGTMMDRSLISPTVPVVNLDQVTFTYTLTKNAEA